jgi:aspartate kinase
MPTKPVIVQKFGGTSVSTPERRAQVVGHVRRALEQGYDVAMVVSAMGRRGDPYATDTLLDLLEIGGSAADPADYTFVFVTGEMIACAVISQALKLAGIPAIALGAAQAGIYTDGRPTEAEIVHIDVSRMRACIGRGEVPVITGGQGIARETFAFNTLGRGASDTSGVAVGVALDAERVEIFTDVEGVASADPRAVPEAVFRKRISFERMHEMGRFGAKVVHPRAVLTGWRASTPIVVRSTFVDGNGTWIGDVPAEPVFTGVATLSPMTTVVVKEGSIGAEMLRSWERHRSIIHLNAESRLVLGGPNGRDLDAALKEAAVDVESRIESTAWVSVIGDSSALQEALQPGAAALASAGVDVHFSQAAQVRATYVIDAAQSTTAVRTLHGMWTAV